MAEDDGDGDAGNSATFSHWTTECSAHEQPEKAKIGLSIILKQSILIGPKLISKNIKIFSIFLSSPKIKNRLNKYKSLKRYTLQKQGSQFTQYI